MTILSFLIVLIILGTVYLIYKTPPPQEDKNLNQLAKDYLKDNYYTDPDTGIRIMAKQSKYYQPVNTNDTFLTIPETYLQTTSNKKERQIQTALNYLKQDKNYTKTTLTKQQKAFLSTKTEILGKYHDWECKFCYKFTNGLVLLLTPQLKTGNNSPFAIETQILFWATINNTNGHYFLREQTFAEKIANRLKNSNDLRLNNYECFTIKKAYTIIPLNHILQNFAGKQKLEIEIIDNQLLVKTTTPATLKELLKVEAIIKKL